MVTLVPPALPDVSGRRVAASEPVNAKAACISRQLKAFLRSLGMTVYQVSQMSARPPFGKGTRAYIRDALYAEIESGQMPDSSSMIWSMRPSLAGTISCDFDRHEVRTTYHGEAGNRLPRASLCRMSSCLTWDCRGSMATGGRANAGRSRLPIGVIIAITGRTQLRKTAGRARRRRHRRLSAQAGARLRNCRLLLAKFFPA